LPTYPLPLDIRQCLESTSNPPACLDMFDRLRVGICGFGVAGGALAILLARAGHKVTLLERAPQVGPVGAGFLLQPSGQRVLKGLGLLERITAQSARIERIEGFTHSGRQLTDLRYSRVVPEACAYGVHRGVLFEELHAAAISAGAAIELAAEVNDWEETSSSVLVRDIAGRAFGPFDLVIGADGARSRLREKLNPGIGQLEYRHGALWGTGRSAEPTDSLHQVTRGTRRLAGLMPIGGGRCTFFWGLAASELDSLKERGFAAFCEEVLAMFPLAAGVLEDIGGFERMTFGGYQHSLPPCVHNERVVLVGDAAHAMSPHLGQGANLALVDAECLARHLARYSLSDALVAYRNERRSQSRYFATLSRLLSPFFQSNSTVLALGRDIALPLLCEIPWIHCQMVLSATGLKRGFFDKLLYVAPAAGGRS
jgi:2-polyprenyl-6-methoxyphenol hydroxylase-like FAD-dependent oxidoreductase